MWSTVTRIRHQCLVWKYGVKWFISTSTFSALSPSVSTAIIFKLHCAHTHTHADCDFCQNFFSMNYFYILFVCVNVSMSHCRIKKKKHVFDPWWTCQSGRFAGNSIGKLMIFENYLLKLTIKWLLLLLMPIYLLLLLSAPFFLLLLFSFFLSEYFVFSLD